MFYNQLSSYLSPKLEARPTRDMRGVFAHTKVLRGELLMVWGGVVMPEAAFMALPEEGRSLSVQVEEGLFLVPEHIGGGDFVNHSCEPNAGLSGQIALVALRDIEPGEEVCFDYAMTDGCPYDEFECLCGQPTCRERITGNDWMLPELQEKYAGHFSPFLQRRIDARRAAESLFQVEFSPTHRPTGKVKPG